ncbi:MAG: hypothetical protein K2X27_25010 [Candidatus Obscuribacterales bacterium]|nr:hypothetical protein [Candidatus Obscuribacterales bacterium]
MKNPAAEKKISAYRLEVGGPIFLFLLILFLFARPYILLGDGGTCRHFLTGLYFLQHLNLPVSTYMSAVEPQASWSTHELLADLLFGLPFAQLGLNWVVLSSSLAIALCLAWSYQMARLRGSGVLISFLTFILSISVCSIHWSARPHLFTYLLFLASYYETFIAQRSLKASLVIFSLIFLCWSNLHGSYFLGLLMLLFKALSDLIRTVKESNTQSRIWSLKESAMLIFSSFLASCLNIRGFAFFTYVISYLTSPKIQSFSDEWRSLDFSLGYPVYAFFALFSLLVFCWVYAERKPVAAEFCYLLFLFTASLYAMRIMPYFALAALPALAQQAAELEKKAGESNFFGFAKLIEMDVRIGKAEENFAGAGWIFSALTVVISAIYLSLPYSKLKDFDQLRMPVQAVNFMQEHELRGLTFSKDNWGSYLYWRLKEPYFIDDKTDFYSQTLLDDYSKIFFGSPGWKQAFDKYGFKYVLIPRGLPLEFSLKAENDWQAVYQDRLAIVFAHQKASARLEFNAADSGKHP